MTVAVQVLEDGAPLIYKNITLAFANKSLADLTEHARQLQNFIFATDRVLSASKYLLLFNWLKSANAMGANEKEKSNLQFNAMNQITLWGPNGQISDYANKNWAGLVSSYYGMRWLLFTDELTECLKNQREYNETAFHRKLLEAEQQWGKGGSEKLPTLPKGDALMISQQIYLTYEKTWQKNREELQDLWMEARQQTESRKEERLQEFLKKRYHL